MEEKVRDLYYKKYRTFKLQYDVLYKWMYCDLYDRTLERALLEQDIHSVIIYGIGEMGGLVYDKLKATSVKVECFIDAYAIARQYYLEGIDVLRPEEAVGRTADFIIISLSHIAESIERDLKNLGITIPMNSIENIVMGM